MNDLYSNAWEKVVEGGETPPWDLWNSTLDKIQLHPHLLEGKLIFLHPNVSRLVGATLDSIYQYHVMYDDYDFQFDSSHIFFILSLRIFQHLKKWWRHLSSPMTSTMKFDFWKVKFHNWRHRRCSDVVITFFPFFRCRKIRKMVAWTWSHLEWSRMDISSTLQA